MSASGSDRGGGRKRRGGDRLPLAARRARRRGHGARDGRRERSPRLMRGQHRRRAGHRRGRDSRGDRVRLVGRRGGGSGGSGRCRDERGDGGRDARREPPRPCRDLQRRDRGRGGDGRDGGVDGKRAAGGLRGPPRTRYEIRGPGRDHQPHRAARAPCGEARAARRGVRCRHPGPRGRIGPVGPGAQHRPRHEAQGEGAVDHPLSGPKETRRKTRFRRSSSSSGATSTKVPRPVRRRRSTCPPAIRAVAIRAVAIRSPAIPASAIPGSAIRAAPRANAGVAANDVPGARPIPGDGKAPGERDTPTGVEGADRSCSVPAVVASPGLAIGVLYAPGEIHRSLPHRRQPAGRTGGARRGGHAGARGAGTTRRTEPESLPRDVIGFQVSLLRDVEFLEPVRLQVDAGVAADRAWEHHLAEEITDYEAAPTAYLRDRAADLRDLRGRVARRVRGRRPVAWRAARAVHRDRR